jgi:hypothetical protein
MFSEQEHSLRSSPKKPQGQGFTQMDSFLLEQVSSKFGRYRYFWEELNQRVIVINTR